LANIPVAFFSEFLKTEFLDSFVSVYQEKVVERVSDFSERNLKQINTTTYIAVLRQLDSLLSSNGASPDELEKIELLELKLALEFIKSGFLEKRIKGVSDLT
jgi:hypothetical protein